MTTKKEDVLEINIEKTAMELPVTAFPPFKLRSAMVDKDPVIWVHLIEIYIQYVETILTTPWDLNERSEQQLQTFVKTYLFEIAEEQGQILSLGLINVQITENLSILRAWMLDLIKNLGVLRLKLNGESLWNMSRIYSPKNAATVRGIIDGSLKPRDNRTISGISQVHRHIESLVSNGKFSKVDLETFAFLVTDKQKVSQRGKKPPRKDQKFGDKFITVSWWETLEKLYAKGQGRFAQHCKEIGILSLISVSLARVAALATELGITSVHSLGPYPLFAGITTSASFGELQPGLDTKIPFLKVKVKGPVDKEHVQSLIAMFPALSVSQTEKLLRKYDHNVESVTNLLLENPEAAVEAVKVVPKVPTADSIIQKKVISKKPHYVPDEHKNRTLNAALKLMYEADEDEHDDTYDEAEAIAGLTGGDHSKYDKMEEYLWNIFKKDPQLLEKSARKSSKRKEIKNHTKWSDEQIEGWARMIQKSPKRAKALESKYMFRGNKPERSSFINGAKDEEEVEQVEERAAKTSAPGTSEPIKSAKNSKRDHARNEKNKASKANHNRKLGHDRKMNKGI